ncbi:FeoB small GTPase domain-containing protein [Shigella flexneri]
MVIQILGRANLFNQLTGARQRVGNWAGVTHRSVKKGNSPPPIIRSRWWTCPHLFSDHHLVAASLDERMACHYILSGDADLLINVVDASNLERNLYLRRYNCWNSAFPALWH